LKYAKVINRTYNKEFDKFKDAVEFYGSKKNIYAIITIGEWLRMPKEFKKTENGQRYLFQITAEEGALYRPCLIKGKDVDSKNNNE
jgi:hypothetical protein